MWLDFYQLREQPFGDTPDPRFLYLSKTHGEALASLFCGIESGRGFLALIAEPGLGKTTLLFQLLERLRHSARTVFLSQTQCDSREFVRHLLDKLGIETQGRDRADLQKSLEEVLRQEMPAGQRLVVVIDEAQELDESVLEGVRLLANLEAPTAGQLQIVLAGTPQLAEKLASPALASLSQRISIVARLEPLDSEDTAHYIDHRLRVAGHEGAALFARRAVERIAEGSQGIPRTVNNLCFGALSAGYALERKEIDAGIVDEVMADLDLGAVVQTSQVFPISPSPLTPQASCIRAAGIVLLAAALVVVSGYGFSAAGWLPGPPPRDVGSIPIRPDRAVASKPAAAQDEQKASAGDPPSSESVRRGLSAVELTKEP